MKHKHAELIKAWADGAKIQYFSGLGYWNDIDYPGWRPTEEYRIRPEKVTRYLWAIKNNVVHKHYWFSAQMFMTEKEVDEAYSNYEHKRLDWSATEFEE